MKFSKSLTQKAVELLHPSVSAPSFNYADAFDRNIGWVTPAEQQRLRTKRVAIAGLGGVGGSHLLTLARLGIGAFNVADFDRFELANFNRQAGATMSSLGLPKADTLARMGKGINPDLDLRIFPQGVDESNLDDFLTSVDVYVDALDFFVLEFRAKVFLRCRELGIPAVTAAPLGMGAGYLVFMPGGMSFEEYFCFHGLTPERQAVNFLLGLAPRGLHRRYLVDASRVDLASKRGPSTAIACELCAGVAGAEVLKILLRRGSVHAAPWYHQFDAYRGKFVRGRLPQGNRSLLQRLKLKLAYRWSERLSTAAAPAHPRAQTEIEAILEQARWSPSGDNSQPWRFRVIDDEHVDVEIGFEESVYDYDDGLPTLLAAGFLLEGLHIAASAHGRSMTATCKERERRRLCIAVAFKRSLYVKADPLLPYLDIRSVDRRRYRHKLLTKEQKAALAEALGDGLELRWRDRPGERWRGSRLNAFATSIRLRIPETYAAHRRIVDTDRCFSPTGIPIRAVGLDPVASRLMSWALHDQRRMNAITRLGGSALAQLELDLYPGMFSAAHFLVLHKRQVMPRDRTEFFVQCGRRLHRFWLTATQLGLAVQPTLASLCFAHYARHGIEFTQDHRMLRKAARLATELEAFDEQAGDRLLFMGRIGEPLRRRVVGRSTRRDLHDLTTSPNRTVARE